ncbi:hypothetical protein DLC20_22915 [Salmonella enterica subsp. enterica serovar Leoben]|nr:hypothetical protein [Salmonella enterica subsp. enterica serovar Leoben]
METRCPEGAGQRQRSWLGAQHDSPGSRQGNRPASAKSVREYQQQNEQAQAAGEKGAKRGPCPSPRRRQPAGFFARADRRPPRLPSCLTAFSAL